MRPGVSVRRVVSTHWIGVHPAEQVQTEILRVNYRANFSIQLKYRDLHGISDSLDARRIALKQIILRMPTTTFGF